MKEMFFKALFCCAVLLMVFLSGLVLLINYLIVNIKASLRKKPTIHGRYG